MAAMVEKAGRMTPRRVKAARWIAAAADFLQIVAFPFFVPGLASPWNDALDFLVGVAMIALIGWHWSFLPSFLAELVPGLDLIPTWTAAVFFVTRGRGASGPPQPGAPATIDAKVLSSTKTG
jgi:hypothetical protein